MMAEYGALLQKQVDNRGPMFVEMTTHSVVGLRENEAVYPLQDQHNHDRTLLYLWAHLP